ncbi:MAG: ATP12 family protein [Pseudomonadota bacterium]
MTDASAKQRPKRFYEAVSVVADGAAWRVHLDGRPIRTPAGAFLVLPTEGLARAVAGEWESQGSHLDIQGMHLTRLANVAIDRTPETREALAENIVKYCETDLTCFLAEDATVRQRQDTLWKPWRAWAGQTLGVLLVPVEGLLASPQPAASLNAARAYALGANNFALTGLAFGCGLYGSALLTFAVAEGALDAQAAFAASIIDETIQAEQWGEDAEAMAAQAARAAESDALGQWLGALSSGNASILQR